MISLLQPGYAPFVAAIGLMIGIGVLEGATLLLGFSLTAHTDTLLAQHFDIDHTVAGAETGLVSQFLGWLHVGRVPLLVLLVLMLTSFAVAGLIIQSTMQALLQFMLPPSLAATLALPISLLFVRRIGRTVGHLLPQEESTALSEIDFVGRPVRIVSGEASKGNPSEARFVDEFGQAHYLRVEPDDAGLVFVRGQTVLIVSRVSGSLYQAIKNPRENA
jgi:hypothetical protein